MIIKLEKDVMRIHTAGHIDGDLFCDSVDSLCGDIKHGIGLFFQHKGAFVVSFEDFERVYLAAKKYREAQRGAE